MRTFVDICTTGLAAVTLHGWRSFVTAFCVVVVLVPFIVAMAISHGVRHEATLAIDGGADIYVWGVAFGQKTPIPRSLGERLAEIDGVSSVTPRIVGEVLLGREQVPCVVVGLPEEHFPRHLPIVAGELPREGGAHQFVVGTGLAERLQLDVGSMIPPFYRSERGERVSKVVGVFDADVSLWQSRLILTTLKSASQIFDQPDTATELLVECRSGYADRVREVILREAVRLQADTAQPLRLRTMTKPDMRALLPRGFLHREGIFSLHYLLMLVAGLLVVVASSGVGSSERRREIGILKATGWQTDEVLLRCAAESVFLALVSAATALLISYLWLRGLNGLWIASVFLGGVETVPSLTIPFRLSPAPAILAFVLSLVIMLTGSLYSTWRAAVVPPNSAMR